MKIKAVFFLFIFMLNTLVGFGCSITMENEEHHHQHHTPAHHHESSSTFVKLRITAPEDNCCKTLVSNFLVQGKLLPDYAKLNLKAPAWVPVDFNFAFIPETAIIVGKNQEINRLTFHPPHPDIRVFIQRFQI